MKAQLHATTHHLCHLLWQVSIQPLFTSRNQELVKIIRHEHNECQLYLQRFDHNMSFVRLEFNGAKPMYVLEWKYLTALLSCPVIKGINSIEIDYDDEAE